MIVMKFGGTSVGSAERIKQVYKIVTARQNQNPIVVVSAVSGVTDLLLNSARKAQIKETDVQALAQQIILKHQEIISQLQLNETLLNEDFSEIGDLFKGIQLIGELSPKTTDLVVSFGEIMSSKIVAEYFNLQGTPSKAYFGWDAGIVTDSNFVNAEIVSQTYNNIPLIFDNLNHIAIVTGFIAKDTQGNITTFGRGGSDYTAAIIGAALNAEEIQIWTDVDGIFTSDPRQINKAKKIDEVSFPEAAELAYFGAKVLHPKTIYPAVKKGIPVRVLNTHNSENTGTLIVSESKSKEQFAAIAFKKNITVVRVFSTRMLLAHGFLSKLFEVFARHKISVDLISTSEVSVSMSLDNTENLDAAIAELKKFGKVSVENNCSSISVVGAGMMKHTDSPGKIFSICAEKRIPITMISQGASQINISFVVKNQDFEKCVNALHEKLFVGA